MGRHFVCQDHPRLQIICSAQEPVLFSADSNLPDPFDGLLADELKMKRIPSCLGCPLIVGNTLIGVLIADAVNPNAFDRLDHGFLAAVGALAGSQLQTTLLIEALERSADRQGLIASDLRREFRALRGSEIIGQSRAIEHLKQEIELVAGVVDSDADGVRAAAYSLRSPAGCSLREATREFQRELIRRSLAHNGGNWAAAARELGLHRSNLHHLAKRLQLNDPSAD